MTEKIPFTTSENDPHVLVNRNLRDEKGEITGKVIRANRVATAEDGSLWSYEEKGGIIEYKPLKPGVLNPEIQEQMARDAVERGDMTPEELAVHLDRVKDMAEKTLEVTGVDEPMPEAEPPTDSAPTDYESMVEVAREVALTEAEEVAHEHEVLDAFEHQPAQEFSSEMPVQEVEPTPEDSIPAQEFVQDEEPATPENDQAEDPEQSDNPESEAEAQHLKRELATLIEHGGNEVVEAAMRYEQAIADADTDYRHAGREVMETVAQLRLLVGGNVSSPIRLLDDARMMITNAYRAMRKMEGSQSEAGTAKAIAIDRHAAFKGAIDAFRAGADELEMSKEVGSDERRQIKHTVEDANEISSRANGVAGHIDDAERPFADLDSVRTEATLKLEEFMRRLDSINPAATSREEVIELMNSIKSYHDDGLFSTLGASLNKTKHSVKDVVIAARKLQSI